MKPLNVSELNADSIPFVARSGLQILESGRGYAKCRMPMEGNGNHVNIMYAGALVTLAEFPAGIMYTQTFDATKYFLIVKNIEVKFVSPAMTDIDVEVRLTDSQIQAAQDKAEEAGKADFEINTELKDANGTVVAKGFAVYQLRAIPGTR